MCENPLIRNRQKGTIIPLPKFRVEQIIKTPKLQLFYKQRIMMGYMDLLDCGKCKQCLSKKTYKLSKLVDVEYNRGHNNYMLTLTFNNKHIDMLGTKEEIDYYRNAPKGTQQAQDASSLSTLSKYAIKKIIVNLRKKMKTYYKRQDIKIHYFLCGEYGGTYTRAHYHIALFTSHPLPNLKLVKGYNKKTCKWVDKYETPLLKSKQYDMYDLEKLSTHNAKKLATYITKYMMKSKDELKSHNKFTNKLNLHQEKTLKEHIEKETPFLDIELWKSDEKEQEYKHMKKVLDIALRVKNQWAIDKWTKQCNRFKMKNCVSRGFFQEEFYKKSRGLGKYDDMLKNLELGTYTTYDIRKHREFVDYINWKKEQGYQPIDETLEQYNYSKKILEYHYHLIRDKIHKNLFNPKYFNIIIKDKIQEKGGDVY